MTLLSDVSMKSISFENIKTLTEAKKIMQHECSNCHQLLKNQSQLKFHLKRDHKLVICDICQDFKKVFPTEIEYFTAQDLQEHKKTGGKDPSFKGHPNCEFCQKYYYSNDELYEHCRDAHEICFLCQRNDIRNQYFRNYDTLTDHFEQDHFPCKESSCLEKKFVVFDNDIDLQAHLYKEHNMKAKSKLNIEFNYTNSRTAQLGQSTSSNNQQRSATNQNNTKGKQNKLENDSLGARARYQMAVEFSNPTPMEVAPITNSVSLTPAQVSIFQPGGPELTTLVFKLLKNKVDKVNNLKILVDNYRLGTITADLLLTNVVELIESLYSRKLDQHLFLELGIVWKQISSIFPEDPYLLNTYEQLLKKSKRKGLSVKEFDQLKQLEPKQTQMLTAWQNFKVLNDQSSVQEIKEQKTGWDMQGSISSSQPKARVLKIDSTKSSKHSALTSRVGGLRLGSRPNVQEFPTLPAVQPITATQWAARPANSNSAANSNNQQKTNKKGKQVLLKFG